MSTTLSHAGKQPVRIATMMASRGKSAKFSISKSAMRVCYAICAISAFVTLIAGIIYAGSGSSAARLTYAASSIIAVLSIAPILWEGGEE